MKKLLLTICCLSLFGLSAMAQNPTTSTAENPLWFYIQVESSGRGAKFVATQSGDSVVGKALATDDPEVINKQLWRFELAPKANRFHIISKATGKKMAPIKDNALGVIIGLTDETPASAWRFLNIGGVYNIQIDPVLDGEPAANKNLLQSTLSYKYVWILSSASPSDNPNAQFQYKTADLLPIVSNEENEVWLYIESAKASNAGKVLTENTNAAWTESFSLEPKTAADSIAQQWKLVKNAKNPARIDFINRKTGTAISTNAQFKKSYFYTQSAVDATDSEGWTLTELKNSQYEVSTINAGYSQHWNATTEGDPSDTYSNGDKNNTAYAWMFRSAKTGGTTDIKESIVDNVRVHSANHRIYVEGADNYVVYNIYGQRQSIDRELPVGLYLVNVNGKTTKILVK